MDNLTDFVDTSDVSDAAIEWVLREVGGPGWGVDECRNYARDGHEDDRAYVIAARLIQQYRPDLLVDPVDVIVREELAKQWPEIAEDFLRGNMDGANNYKAAKRLYLMGIEAGKKS